MSDEKYGPWCDEHGLISCPCSRATISPLVLKSTLDKALAALKDIVDICNDRGAALDPAFGVDSVRDRATKAIAEIEGEK